jgi:hypothetical protein
VSDDYVEVTPREQVRQPAASSDNRPGVSELYGSKVMDDGTCGIQLISEPSWEAEREFHSQGGLEMTGPGQGRQHRLDPAIKVAGIDVQDRETRAGV